ncbi:MAG: hypothetical protein RIM33_16145 [Alphaproteobacteria bacterium]
MADKSQPPLPLHGADSTRPKQTENMKNYRFPAVFREFSAVMPRLRTESLERAEFPFNIKISKNG